MIIQSQFDEIAQHLQDFTLVNSANALSQIRTYQLRTLTINKANLSLTSFNIAANCQVLKLNGCNLCDETLQTLDFHGKTLCLSDNNLSSNCFKFFRGFTSMRTLDLSHNYITKDGLHTLLQEFKLLTEVDLSDNSIIASADDAELIKELHDSDTVYVLGNNFISFVEGQRTSLDFPVLLSALPYIEYDSCDDLSLRVLGQVYYKQSLYKTF